jgi:periplasmic protein TonB
MKNLAGAVAIVLALPSAASVALATSQDTERVYQGKEVAALPVVTYEAKPTYSAEAMRQSITGQVVLECIVRRDGTPSDIVVTKPLYPSLDEAAVAALKQWRFKPGARGLTDVSVRIQLTMSFELR